MKSFVFQRITQAVVIVCMITITVFIILRLSAGDPARIKAPVFARADIIEQYRRDFGTDRPLIEQLSSFVTNAVQGDLGDSFRYQAPVTELIWNAMPNTLVLASTALLFSVTIAVVLGSLAAQRPQSIWAVLASTVAVFGQSAPVFWTGSILVLIFAVGLGWFPAGGGDGFSSVVLPAFAVMLSILPTQLRILRAAMERALQDEYIRTARAFGISNFRIVFVYALKNAFLPLLTVIGLDIGYLLGGVIVAEVVFAYPGIGELALIALNSRDFPLIQGITIVSASLFVAVNLGIDLLYTALDPRIRLEHS
ncbi:MAG: ABC transporter permease [Roseibium album]|uniref:ABC transporter permease n=1 Tax=Roseibium album TaxID=311410 RepID=UPI0032EC498F